MIKTDLDSFKNSLVFFDKEGNDINATRNGEYLEASFCLKPQSRFIPTNQQIFFSFINYEDNLSYPNLSNIDSLSIENRPKVKQRYYIEYVRDGYSLVVGASVLTITKNIGEPDSIFVDRFCSSLRNYINALIPSGYPSCFIGYELDSHGFYLNISLWDSNPKGDIIPLVITSVGGYSESKELSYYSDYLKVYFDSGNIETQSGFYLFNIDNSFISPKEHIKIPINDSTNLGNLYQRIAQIYGIGFSSDTDGDFSDILNIDYVSVNVDLTETYFPIAKFSYEVEVLAKDDRSKELLSLFGREISEEFLVALKELDINESVIDEQILQRKEKELLVSGDIIDKFRGTYQSLFYFLKFWGWSDLELKEYWINKEDNTKTQVTYGNKVPSHLINDSKYFKSNKISLNLQYLKETELLDDYGYPVMEKYKDFSMIELLLKLFTLKKLLNKEFELLHTTFEEINIESLAISIGQIQTFISKSNTLETVDTKLPKMNIEIQNEGFSYVNRKNYKRKIKKNILTINKIGNFDTFTDACSFDIVSNILHIDINTNGVFCIKCLEVGKKYRITFSLSIDFYEGYVNDESLFVGTSLTSTPNGHDFVILNKLTKKRGYDIFVESKGEYLTLFNVGDSYDFYFDKFNIEEIQDVVITNYVPYAQIIENTSVAYQKNITSSYFNSNSNTFISTNDLELISYNENGIYKNITQKTNSSCWVKIGLDFGEYKLLDFYGTSFYTLSKKIINDSFVTINYKNFVECYIEIQGISSNNQDISLSDYFLLSQLTENKEIYTYFDITKYGKYKIVTKLYDYFGKLYVLSRTIEIRNYNLNPFILYRENDFSGYSVKDNQYLTLDKITGTFENPYTSKSFAFDRITDITFRDLITERIKEWNFDNSKTDENMFGLDAWSLGKVGKFLQINELSHLSWDMLDFEEGNTWSVWITGVGNGGFVMKRLVDNKQFTFNHSVSVGDFQTCLTYLQKSDLPFLFSLRKCPYTNTDAIHVLPKNDSGFWNCEIVSTSGNYLLSYEDRWKRGNFNGLWSVLNNGIKNVKKGTPIFVKIPNDFDKKITWKLTLPNNDTKTIQSKYLFFTPIFKGIYGIEINTIDNNGNTNSYTNDNFLISQ